MAQVSQHQGQLPQKLAFLVPNFLELVLPRNFDYVYQWIHEIWIRPNVGGPDTAMNLVCELEAVLYSAKCCRLKTALVRFSLRFAQPSHPSLRALYHFSCAIQW